MQALIIDDDTQLCALLADYMAQVGIKLVCEHGAEPALRRLRAEHFDVVLLDIMLPGIDGLEMLKSLRFRSQIPVIMISARGEEADRVLGLDLGADDFVAKPFSSRELVSRMRALFRRIHPVASSRISTVGEMVVDFDRNLVMLGADEIRLTNAEMAILWLLVQRLGSPVSRDELFQTALQRSYTPLDRSLDIHMSNLRKKLTTQRTGPTITAVRGFGYQLAA